MAVRSGFWNSVGTDIRTYYNRDFSHLISLLVKDGVHQNYGSALTVAQGTGMQVIVRTGEAWFNDTWVRSDSDMQVNIDQAPIVAGFSRIDAIAIKIDARQSVREGTIEYIAGTATSETPSAPELVDTDEIHWHLLATILVRTNDEEIPGSRITNYVGTDTTPFISGILDTISAEVLINQWQSEWTEWSTEKQTEFITWFNNLHYILDGDVAGHLQNEIDDIYSKLTNTGGARFIITTSSEYEGATVTVTSPSGQDVQTKTFNSELSLLFTGLLEVGNYIITCSMEIGGTTRTSNYLKNIPYYGSYEFDVSPISLDYVSWLESAGISPSGYNSLDDVLADETALRQLFTMHSSVDMLCSHPSETVFLTTILNNDLAAKWINLRDYALDKLFAVPAIKAIMDEADKYGYGEWALMPQIPKMTSNSAPYGTITASTTLDTAHANWKITDGDPESCWLPNSNVTNNYICYNFEKPIKPSKVKITLRYGIASGHSAPEREIIVQASNDGFVNDIRQLGTISSPTMSAYGFRYFELSVADSELYSAVRIWSTQTLQINNQWSIGVGEMQVYSWQPKGCIPKMIANDSPYGTAIASSEYNSSTKAYMAFDDDFSNRWFPNANDSIGNAYIGYKFTNPVILKKVRLFADNNRLTKCKIQASNNLSTWTDVTDEISLDYASGAIKENNIAVDNSNAYLAYRVKVTASAQGITAVTAEGIQFYGRQLSVSNPPMTSDTEPYGSSSASGVTTGSGSPGKVYSAWRAFDKNEAVTESWVSETNDRNNGWVRYNFTAPMVLKFFKLKNDSYDGWIGAQVKNFKIQGSNDGFTSDINDLGDFTNTNLSFGGVSTYNVDNDMSYKSYRLKIMSNNGSSAYTAINTLDFFGYDYSEREFEQGSSKRYLYDHGLELTEMTLYTQSGSTEKKYDSLYISANSGSYNANAYATNYINLTAFSRFRAKITDLRNNVMLFITNAVPVLSGEGSKVVASQTYNTPLANQNALCLDVSSINNEAYVMMAVSNNANVDIAEMWLE